MHKTKLRTKSLNFNWKVYQQKMEDEEHIRNSMIYSTLYLDHVRYYKVINKTLYQTKWLSSWLNQELLARIENLVDGPKIVGRWEAK